MYRKSKYKDEPFFIGLRRLGFESEIDKNLYFTENIKDYEEKPSIWFHLEKAYKMGATAVFFRQVFEGKADDLIPQIYIYDFSNSLYSDSYNARLTEIHKKIWSARQVPLTCIFFATEIKIIDCTVPINTSTNEPVYLIENLSLTGKIHKTYNQIFADKIKSGVFWEEKENKNRFSFNNSSYDKLISFLRENVFNKITEIQEGDYKNLIHKLIIQSILIKYLEERKSDENKVITKVFEISFFKKFKQAQCFCDVLRNGTFFDLCEELNKKDKFNGHIFDWSEIEKKKIKEQDLKLIADALDGRIDIGGQHLFWRQYDFNFVPVELISRLYEEFIIKYDDKKNKGKDGKVYTPVHLAKFLVDEAMPLCKYKDIDIDHYEILDPACGSGIFLVIAFKRLVQWWRLKNNMKKPSSNDLKKILSKSVFGTDKDKKAVQLTAFSLNLAICDELSPKEIWEDLHFDDLTKSNIFCKDFFDWKNSKKKNCPKFDLVIGNPPFIRGGVKSENIWKIKGEKVKIPQNQIALKFLSESTNILKNKGLSVLIIKANFFLYSHSSMSFKKAIFSNFNIKQILDFTPLARNKSLWDCDTDVAAAAVFLKNENPDSTNILHAIFRRTKVSKKRIFFEIDDYDLHFITRQEAIENPFIWKINMLGGGRIKNIINKSLEFKNLELFVKENRCKANDGFIKGKNGQYRPDFIYKMQYIPTEAVTEHQIDFSKLSNINSNEVFVQVPEETTFVCPNVVIKKNIGENRIPVFLNMDKRFSFKDKLIGLYSIEKDVSFVKTIYKSFTEKNDLYRFIIFCTSGQLLINLNTAFQKEDIMRLPMIPSNVFDNMLSDIDKDIIADVNNTMQKFMRHGERSDAVSPVSIKDNQFIIDFGEKFSNTVNMIYEDKDKRFRLSDIIRFDGNLFIGTIFSYDNYADKPPKVHNIETQIDDLKELISFDFSRQLRTKRIIKYYQKNKVIFIKPNQKRFWMSLNAYRDADKVIADMAMSGY